MYKLPVNRASTYFTLVFAFFLYTVLLDAYIIACANYSIKYFKDIPNVVGKNYIIAIGTAYDWNTSGQESETRGFQFQKDDGEIINLVVNYPPIYQGDRFEVIYLPNTGYGAIIRKIENGELP